MLNTEDLKLLQSKGISQETFQEQLDTFKTGFPYLKIEASAAIGNGITKFSEQEIAECIEEWENFLTSGGAVEKFVPASGAASRMFKNMFEFLNGENDVPTSDFEKKFFTEIEKFAFYDALNEACIKNHTKGIKDLIAENKYKSVVECMLNSCGLNYGFLPKALLQFHKVNAEVHTPLEEHLEEGAQYATDKDRNVNIHFTVSPEHKPEFIKLINAKVSAFAEKWGVKYNVSMSEQKSSTDTIAVDIDNNPYREDGKLLFRPAGHGALLENLNDIDADVVFVKNIDNVVPSSLRAETIKFKKVIGGYLVKVQKQIKTYLEMLDCGKYNMDDVHEMETFLHNTLCVRYDDTKNLEDCELVLYVKNKLNRPIRVCGMVKNDGEPGGGPYIAYNSDGSRSPQILESAQFDMSMPESEDLIKSGTHFNPVDLVCYIKDYKGNKFNLKNYVDKKTGLISEKSKSGTTLKALELPGLWNGSMSDWNTIFVDVPLATFNPVKTVNDLLRVQHQG